LVKALVEGRPNEAADVYDLYHDDKSNVTATIGRAARLVEDPKLQYFLAMATDLGAARAARALAGQVMTSAMGLGMMVRDDGFYAQIQGYGAPALPPRLMDLASTLTFGLGENGELATLVVRHKQRDLENLLAKPKR
jgi:hypothetical protein